MFVDVILPLPFSDLFTYSVPEQLQQEIEPGYRVVVPFGSKKHYTGIVRRVHNDKPIDFEVKEIHSSLDSRPVVIEQQLKLWEWISFYYLSPLGDVYKAALPPTMKPEDLQREISPRTETYLKLNDSLDSESISSLVRRAKKQQALLERIKECLRDNEIDRVRKKEVAQLDEYSPSALKGLIEKEIVHALEMEALSEGNNRQPTREPYPLNEVQQQAYEAIIESFLSQQACLLHGVTSSGKTEIYAHLM